MFGALWGNSQHVDVSESLSSDGQVLSITGKYDNGNVDQYRFYKSHDRCIKDSGVQTRRSPSFKPFEIVSSKTNETISSDELEQEVMCKNPIESAELARRLITDFDLLYYGGDQSNGLTAFAGQQNNEPVVVTIVRTSPPEKVSEIDVNDDTVITCIN